MVKDKKTASSGAALINAAETLNDANARGADASSFINSIDLEQYIIDTTAEIGPPNYRLEIDGVGVIPPGITAVCGKAKQGKTQFLNVIAATLISGRAFGNMRPLTAPGALLWIDTEQNRWEIQNNSKRLLRAASLDEKTDTRKIGLTILSLRELGPVERCDVIEKALDTFAPNVVIIDGLRDMLNNFNDETESNKVIQMLMTATTKNEDLTIIGVLHYNDGTDKMRGHLGTELWNKCNTRFECAKDNGFFQVKHLTRQREAAPFIFRINEAGDYEAGNMVDAAGVINDADALALCFDGGNKECGLTFDDLLKRYKKFAALKSLKEAKSIILMKLNKQRAIVRGEDKLFYLA